LGRGFKFIQIKRKTLPQGEIIGKEYKYTEIFEKYSLEPAGQCQSNLLQINIG
jgi:hypothetical protein